MEEFRFSPRLNRAHEIRWREWSPEAFQEAERLDKPILLAISAVWCHWCHVMDETSYSDPRVIQLLNREYVPIRVDNDRRPELNQRYNMGGWPSTSFLTPQGDILTGATYLPADGFLSIAAQVVEYYRNRKVELYSRILEQRAKTAATAVPSAVPADAPDRVLDYLTAAFDFEFGGFGTEPKFPQADALEFLLEEYHRTGDFRLKQMISTTLKNMRSGGMFDKVAGGFFRYSTNRDWSVPHYEKMTEDNAALLKVYLHAYQLLGDASLSGTAGRVVDYVLATLYDPETGGFFGSQDADEEYYQLTPEERAHREPPLVDRTIYTPWTAAMVSSFLEAARVLGRPELEGVALRALDFLWESMYREGQGMYHYYDGQAKGQGILTDQVWALAALLDAYETTGLSPYLDRSESLARFVHDNFGDPAGGYYDISEGLQGLGRLQIRDKSIVENSLAAGTFLRLYHEQDDEMYRRQAEPAVGAFAADYLKFGPYAATYVRSVRWLLEDPLRIEIVGEAEETRPWREAALSFYHPRRVVRRLDTSKDASAISWLGQPAGQKPAAYVCYQMACSAPVEHSEDLPGAVEKLVSSARK